MKTIFKVSSIVLLVCYSLIAISNISDISKISSSAAGHTGADAAMSGLNVLIIILGLIPVGIAIFMTIAGLKENYDFCFKLSALLLVIVIVSFMLSKEKNTGVISLAIAIVYCFMAKMLASKY